MGERGRRVVRGRGWRVVGGKGRKMVTDESRSSRRERIGSYWSEVVEGETVKKSSGEEE